MGLDRPFSLLTRAPVDLSGMQKLTQQRLFCALADLRVGRKRHGTYSRYKCLVSQFDSALSCGAEKSGHDIVCASSDYL